MGGFNFEVQLSVMLDYSAWSYQKTPQRAFGTPDHLSWLQPTLNPYSCSCKTPISQA
jgi:hypothetical protein